MWRNGRTVRVGYEGLDVELDVRAVAIRPRGAVVQAEAGFRQAARRRGAHRRTSVERARLIEGRTGHHRTALLIKALASKSQPVINLPIDELFEDALGQKVPIEEWPTFIYQR